jgi:hypothetical protein
MSELHTQPSVLSIGYEVALIPNYWIALILQDSVQIQQAFNRATDLLVNNETLISCLPERNLVCEWHKAHAHHLQASIQIEL